MKYRIICFIISLLSFLLCCNSCSNQSENVNELSIMAGRGDVYNGLFYSFYGNTISYIDCKVDITPIPLCSDSLCSHKDESCPAYFPDLGKRLLLINSFESEKNSKYPIIYVSCCYGNDNRIIRFNTKTNKKNILVKNVPNFIQSIWVYNNLLFYTTFDGDNQLNIKAINMDDLRAYELKNDEKLRYYIGGIDQEHIYFTDYDGNIYRSPHDLSSKEQIGRSVTCGKVYISIDKIFFFSNIHIGTTVKETDFLACDLYSVDKNNIHDTPTLVLENVSYIGVPVMFQYGETLFYSLCSNVVPHQSLEVFHSQENITSTVQLFDDGTSSIYTYNILTKESKNIIKNSDYNIGMFLGADNRYFVYSGFQYNIDEISEHGIQTSTIIVDYIDNKQYVY